MERRERSEERKATFPSVRQYFNASMIRSREQRRMKDERTKSAIPGRRVLLLGTSGKLPMRREGRRDLKVNVNDYAYVMSGSWSSLIVPGMSACIDRRMWRKDGKEQ